MNQSKYLIESKIQPDFAHDAITFWYRLTATFKDKVFNIKTKH